MPVPAAIGLSFSNRQISFGCQKFRNPTRQSIDTAEDRIAVSSGPMYRLMRKLGMA